MVIQMGSESNDPNLNPYVRMLKHQSDFDRFQQGPGEVIGCACIPSIDNRRRGKILKTKKLRNFGGKEGLNGALAPAKLAGVAQPGRARRAERNLRISMKGEAQDADDEQPVIRAESTKSIIPPSASCAAINVGPLK